ncbi:hypothetical protein JW721_02070 [Candidatus Micrarchaeota archaeon]|nr:hypothetical protein [Candidatus Micrarchaeota archaeon]
MKMHRVLMQKEGAALSGGIRGKHGGQDMQLAPRQLARMLNSSHAPTRWEALRQLKGKKALTLLAINSGYPDVRRDATAMIKDDELLYKVARESKDPLIQTSAVGEISSQQMLVRMMGSQSIPPHAREVAMSRIDDLPAAKGRRDSAILEPINTANVDELRRMSLNSPCPKTRVAAGLAAVAFTRELNRMVLAEIAEETVEINVGIAAIRKIRNPGLLENLALSDTLVLEKSGKTFAPILQLEAVKNTHCPECLKRVLLGSGKEEVRDAAAVQIASLRGGAMILVNIIVSAKSPHEGISAAIRALHDVELLEGISGNVNANAGIRLEAGRRIVEIEQFEARLAREIEVA